MNHLIRSNEILLDLLDFTFLHIEQGIDGNYLPHLGGIIFLSFQFEFNYLFVCINM